MPRAQQLLDELRDTVADVPELGPSRPERSLGVTTLPGMTAPEVLSSPLLRSTSWSGVLKDVQSGEVLWEHNPDTLLRTASVAKVFVLVELADAILAGRLLESTLLDRREVAPVGDSGLWQHLEVSQLATGDVARLVGTVSDNWATNVLINRLGLDAIQRRAQEITSRGSMLHDLVRDERRDGATLSEGCAADWATLFAGLASRTLVSPDVSGLVRGWLSASTDLSMVASALGLDPLSHMEPTHGLRLWNKTGTDDGVRADVGAVISGDRQLAYAVICNWAPDTDAPLPAVISAMREIGNEILGLTGP